MRSILSIVTIAGAALLVSACGGGASNNTAANAADAGNVVSNEPTMAPMNEGMPPADNGAMNVSTTGNATTTTTTVTTTTNAANGM